MSKTFKQVTEPEDNLLILDALNLGFRWLHSGATVFKDYYLKTVESLKKSYKAKWVIIAADQGSSSYRKAIYPEYKQNRKDRYETQTPEDKLKFELFFEEYQRTLDLFRETTTYPVLQFDKTEADDIAAYIVSLGKHLPVSHTWLISTDRDWHLLVSETVSQFSYVTGKEITANNWHTHHDYTQEEYISIKCLTGDSGDNIPGVEAVGPKRAKLLVEQYGTALDLVASLPIQSNLKYIKNLNTSGEIILRNYLLMDLVTYCKDAIGKQNCEKITEIVKGYVK